MVLALWLGYIAPFCLRVTITNNQTNQPLQEMNTPTIIHTNEEQLSGHCTCKGKSEYYKRNVLKVCCIKCISRATIYSDDKYYSRLLKIFNSVQQVPTNAIQEYYIMFGKNFEATKENIIAEFDLNESDICDEIEKYDEVEIVPCIEIQEPEVFISDPLPPPVQLGKRKFEDSNTPSNKKQKIGNLFEDCEIPEDCELVELFCSVSKKVYGCEIRKINEQIDPLNPFAYIPPVCVIYYQ